MEDYQKIIETNVTNGRGYEPISHSKRNSEVALQAQLASMNGQSYGTVNELLQLDEDLKSVGISDLVLTPEQVNIALSFKNRLLRYVQNTAFTVSRFVKSDSLEKILSYKSDDISPIVKNYK